MNVFCPTRAGNRISYTKSAGALNMESDLEMLSRVKETGERLMRFYTFDPPCLTVGRMSSAPAEVEARCREGGVDFIRRPTGGGAVLHEGDLTYAVAGRCIGSVIKTYRHVAGGLLRGLALLGITGEIGENQSNSRVLACFKSATGADLTAGGAKLVGSAQMRSEGHFLQHGSIPVKDIRAKTAQLLGTTLDTNSTFMEALVSDLTLEDVAGALHVGLAQAGFEASFGLART